MAKILSLLLAIAIWFLIKNYLTEMDPTLGNPPRAKIVEEPGNSQPQSQKKR